MGLPKTLRRLVTEGLVGTFIPGESWKRGDAATKSLLRTFPDLRKDLDLDKGNGEFYRMRVARSRSDSSAGSVG